MCDSTLMLMAWEDSEEKVAALQKQNLRFAKLIEDTLYRYHETLVVDYRGSIDINGVVPGSLEVYKEAIKLIEDKE